MYPIEKCAIICFVIFRINLVSIPEVYLSPQDYKILRGVDTYVYCSFEGAPQPAIEWRSHTSKDEYVI